MQQDSSQLNSGVINIKHKTLKTIDKPAMMGEKQPSFPFQFLFFQGLLP